MKQSDLNLNARKIVDDNIYLTLATAWESPWAAPVYYCTDPDYNFYFISQMDSLHTQHILRNPTVAFAIFDSHQPEGTGNGFQATGTVTLLESIQDITTALQYYHTSFIDCQPSHFDGSQPYRLFKLTPHDCYILDPEADTDKRVRVTLK